VPISRRAARAPADAPVGRWRRRRHRPTGASAGARAARRL